MYPTHTAVLKSLGGRRTTRAARLAAAVSVALASALALAGSAFADAADPVISGAGATTGSAVVNADGSRTVTLSGNWRWTTHHSDCNFDKRAVGFAVDWGDNNGNLVTGPNGNFHVGLLNATNYNGTTQPVDNAVHPTPAGPPPANQNPAYGGCGVFAAHVAPEPVGSYNTGSWGPITHTYAAGNTPIAACPLMYDVHLKTDAGAPNNAKETTAGGANNNDDNSAHSNGATPLGNGCFALTFPALTTNASGNTQAGSPVHDTATLAGGDNPTGGIVFNLYDNATCTGPAVYTSPSVPVNGNGSYDSPETSPAAGTYHWVATYSGDAKNAAVTTACSDVLEDVTIVPPGQPIPPPTVPGQVVVPEEITPGSASLAGATGCVSRSFVASVRGKQIRRVVFSIDGKRRATVSKPDSKGRYTLRVNPRKFKRGSHLLVAKATFEPDSATKTKTMRLRFSRCVRRAAPAFTG
jgi:hypothetical protein